MGRPAAGLDDYLKGQQRLESFQESGLTADEFCQQEGLCLANYYHWVNRLRDGILPHMLQDQAHQKQAESGESFFSPWHSKPHRLRSNYPMAL